MQTSEFLQTLMLWFVAAIFLETSSGISNPAIGLAAIVALLVTYVVPLYLVGEVLLLVTE